MATDLIFKLYQNERTVFSFREIAMIAGESNMDKLKQRINYYVRTKKLANPRRGVYTKENYSSEELACKIFTPAYISLEYVLQKAGVVFQYNPTITTVSYVSRMLEVDHHHLQYRKLKNSLLFNSAGITMNDKGISMATPERAFLDKIYLDKDFYVDLVKGLNREKIVKLFDVYQSASLEKSALNILAHA